jgi:hypothetical protein
VPMMLCVMSLSRPPWRVDTRRATTNRARDCVRLFQLASQLLDEALEIAKSIHDLINTLVSVLRCWTA